MEEQLGLILERRYGARAAGLERVGELNPVYRVLRGGEPAWIVRVGRNVPRYAACLRYLEEVGYPAPRLVRTVEGAPLAALGDRPVMVMTCIPGGPPPLRPEAMELVGEALGRLHALPPVGLLPGVALEDGTETPPVRRAGMLVRGEMAFARSCLDSVRSRVPLAHRGHFEVLEEACREIVDCEDLPRCFIHGDAHHNNTVLTPTGELVYVDFDSAGPGPAIVDLGFLLVNADAGPIVAPPRARDPARVRAVLRGYGRHRALTELERGRLIHAIRFRPLVRACATFADEIGRGGAPSEWPLDRLRMSDALAALALDAAGATG